MKHFTEMAAGKKQNTLNHGVIGAGMWIGCGLAAVAVRKIWTISALVFVRLSFKVTVTINIVRTQAS